METKSTKKLIFSLTRSFVFSTISYTKSKTQLASHTKINYTKSWKETKPLLLSTEPKLYFFYNKFPWGGRKSQPFVERARIWVRNPMVVRLSPPHPLTPLSCAPYHHLLLLRRCRLHLLTASASHALNSFTSSPPRHFLQPPNNCVFISLEP